MWWRNGGATNNVSVLLQAREKYFKITAFPKQREQFEVWKQFSSIHLILHDNKGDAIAFVLSSYSRLRKTSTSGSWEGWDSALVETNGKICQVLNVQLGAAITVGLRGENNWTNGVTNIMWGGQIVVVVHFTI